MHRFDWLAATVYLCLGALLIWFAAPAAPDAGLQSTHTPLYAWICLLVTAVLLFFTVQVLHRRHLTRDRERLSNEAQLRIHSTVYNEIMEGVVVTDADNRIISVNPAFSHIMGFRPEEVVGKNPSFFKSGKHDSAFYLRMWESLQANGSWSGEIWNRRKDGSMQPEWLNITQVCNDAGKVTHYVGSFTDTSVIRASQEQLHHLANHDVLTGLPNRLLFKDRLSQAIKHAQRGDYKVAVLFMDLDDFKIINDTLGHQAGDELLRQASLRLEGLLRKGDTVARLGGDEFVILLNRLDRSEYAAVVAGKVEQQLRLPFPIAGRDHFVGVSIGIAMFPQDGENADLLVRHADISMYRAKELGKGQFQFYAEDLSATVNRRAELESDLRKALEQEQLLLFYQPQFLLDEERVVGVEVLLRWQHPTLGLLLPGDFIPLAEQTGLILPIGEWVLNQACRQAHDWDDKGLRGVRVAVNISTVQIQHGDILNHVEKALCDSGLAPERLELELNEGFVMGDVERNIAVLKQLKMLGVGIAIDDFGTSYSSLSHLQKLPVDRLKLDRTFLAGIPTDKGHCAIANAIVSLSDKLRIPVVAEGVETDEQLSFITGIGCQAAQGYRYTKPIPLAQLLREYAQ